MTAGDSGIVPVDPKNSIGTYNQRHAPANENCGSEMPNAWHINRVCRELETRLDQGEHPVIEEHLDCDHSYRDELLAELLDVEMTFRLSNEQTLGLPEYYERFPNDIEIVDRVYEAVKSEPFISACAHVRHIEAGRYEFGEEIARGGMGIILRATDCQLNRPLAAKTLLETHARSPEARLRLIREAYVCSRLQHPGIVPVHGIGWLDNRPFFTMTLVEGFTLTEQLKRRQTPDSDRIRFLRVYASICQAVAYAHSKKTVHRDLKPGNIMLGHHGEVLVMDWGLAKVLGDDPVGEFVDDLPLATESDDSSLSSDTQLGRILGTPPYMSPEQSQGDNHRVDYRSDVYSLGAILCEVLTGRPPSQDEHRDQMDDQATYQRLDSCEADKTLVDLAKRCLISVRDDRPSNAGVLARVVNDYITQVEHRSRDVEAKQIRRAERQNQRWSLAFCVAIIGLLGFAVREFITADRVSESRYQGIEDSLRRLTQQSAANGNTLGRDDWEHHSQTAAELGIDPGSTPQEIKLLKKYMELLVELNHAIQEDEVLYSSHRTDKLREIASRYRGVFDDLDVGNESVAEAELMELPSDARQLVMHAWTRWAMCSKGAEQQAIFSLIRRHDGDALRATCRRLVENNEPLELIQKLRNTSPSKVEALPSSFLQHLAIYLDESGNGTAARRLLRTSSIRRGDDFMINFELGRMAEESEPRPNWQLASASYAVAASIQPTAGVYCRFGDASRHLNRKNDARECYRRAIEINASYGPAHRGLSLASPKK